MNVSSQFCIVLLVQDLADCICCNFHISSILFLNPLSINATFCFLLEVKLPVLIGWHLKG